MTNIDVFMDISKAFDSTWHKGLIYKLVSMNVPAERIRVIDSFLAQKSFSVKIDGAFSGWRPILAGVPQGGLLSPLLYNL
jgi:Reverse transcriptase (RNA-dependent DNA polymerase).